MKDWTLNRFPCYERLDTKPAEFNTPKNVFQFLLEIVDGKTYIICLNVNILKVNNTENSQTFQLKQNKTICFVFNIHFDM